MRPALSGPLRRPPHDGSHWVRVCHRADATRLGGVVHVAFPPSRHGEGTMAIRTRLRSERQAPCAAHWKEWSEVTSQVLPHGLQPGTHLGAQCGNDQVVPKVIPAGQVGKLDGGALDGHPTLCPYCYLLLLPHALLSDEDHVTVSPPVLMRWQERPCLYCSRNPA